MNKKTRTKLIVIIFAVLIGAAVAWGGSYQGQTLGALPLFALAFAFSYLLQWLLFIPAVLKGTEVFYDLAGGIGFVSTTLLLLLLTPQVGSLGWILGIMVIAWSLRLSIFLFRRVLSSRGDDRFDAIKQDKLRFFLTWTLQALWVSVTASAAWAVITSSHSPGLRWLSVIGILIWALGWSLEVIADNQKKAFRARPENQGRFITSGLWSISRHPNYLGEITLWIGMFIAAAPALAGWQWVTLLSPLVVTILLTKVSGIPLLEQKADARWGGQADYEAYKAATPVLLPTLRRQ